jgi:O-antigen/teichoic acid export membrane protein
LGWQLNGVLFSLILTSIFALLLINFFINKKITLPKVKEVKVPWREISKYGLPVLFSNLAQTSFYTSDVLLVKSLFPADQAGLYASLSILGKIVFFASSSIGMVMFPLVAGKKARGENYRRIYLNSFLLVFLVSFGITLVYFLFPKLMVNLLYGSQYLAIAPLLGLFAVFMSFYALVYLTVNFFLAAARTVMIVLPITGAVLQAVLIYFYHSSLRQVVLINIWVMAGLFFGLIALPLVKYLKSGRLHSFVLIKKNEKITA